VKYPFIPGNESVATVQSLGEVADEKKEIIVKHENVLLYS
jgi:hypothetical protein